MGSAIANHKNRCDFGAPRTSDLLVDPKSCKSDGIRAEKVTYWSLLACLYKKMALDRPVSCLFLAGLKGNLKMQREAKKRKTAANSGAIFRGQKGT